MKAVCSSSDGLRPWVLGLLLFGALLRPIAASFSPGIVHPDEHQQYLEQAFRLVHGYGAVFWEQERGMRHPLLPTLLAGALWVSEQLGIEDPHVLAGLFRTLMSLAAYGAMAYLAWNVFQRGERIAGLTLAFLLAASIDLLFIHVRVLSETAATIGLSLALVWWPQRPARAGLALGLMVAFRLQTAPLALGFVSLALWSDLRTSREKIACRLFAGLAIALLAAGLHDYVHFGSFFHSARANVTANWVEGGANQFGTSPADRYFSHGPLILLRASAFGIPLFLWGLWLRRDLAWCVGLFVLAHTLIPHKEMRFLWPLAPIACYLIAVAIEDLWFRCLSSRPKLLACLAASVILASVVRVGLMQWKLDVYAKTSWALAEIGKREDSQAVAIVGVPRAFAANYFYLRKPIEIDYVNDDDPTVVRESLVWSGRINYVIARPGYLPSETRSDFEAILEFDDWMVLRRNPK